MIQKNYTFCDDDGKELINNKFEFFTQILSDEISNSYWSFNNFKQQIFQNITFEEIKDIFNTPIFDLNKDEKKNLKDSIYFINNSKIEFNSTNDSTKLLEISSSNGNKETPKKNNFKTKLYHKRGRKVEKNNSRKKKKKFHSSNDFDNIQRKIQVHFINFLIKFANDIIKSILGKKNKLYFKDIKYKYKNIVNYDYVQYLKHLNYSDILQKEITSRNKNFDENYNKNLYEKICNTSDVLRKIFDKSYLYIFQKYYYNLKINEKEIYLDGKKITLSNKIKPFYNLLMKNKGDKEKFINIANDVYFSDINYLMEMKFITNNFIV